MGLPKTAAMPVAVAAVATQLAQRSVSRHPHRFCCSVKAHLSGWARSVTRSQSGRWLHGVVTRRRSWSRGWREAQLRRCRLHHRAPQSRARNLGTIDRRRVVTVVECSLLVVVVVRVLELEVEPAQTLRRTRAFQAAA